MRNSPAARAADALEAVLRSVGDPEQAPGQQRYLKSNLEFLGCTVGQTRAAVKGCLAQLPDRGHDCVVSLVEELWQPAIHDRRLAGALVLQHYAPMLGVADLDLIEGLVRRSFTWAYVDLLAGDVAGRIHRADPAGTRPVLERWAADDDLWLRRSALLSFLVPLKTSPEPFALFAGYADRMLEEREFFIRKAIGWVLRDAGKRYPELVTQWLGPRTARASGVTMREAVKYLAPQDRQRLMAAHRARRPA